MRSFLIAVVLFALCATADAKTYNLNGIAVETDRTIIQYNEKFVYADTGEEAVPLAQVLSNPAAAPIINSCPNCVMHRTTQLQQYGYEYTPSGLLKTTCSDGNCRPLPLTRRVVILDGRPVYQDTWQPVILK